VLIYNKKYKNKLFNMLLHTPQSSLGNAMQCLRQFPTKLYKKYLEKLQEAFIKDQFGAH